MSFLLYFDQIQQSTYRNTINNFIKVLISFILNNFLLLIDNRRNIFVQFSLLAL
jgi:hypothetical protein